VTSYVFSVQLAEEDDGRWSAWIEALPGCATWGHSREEALRNLQDAAEAYLRDVRKAGAELPPEAAVQVAETPLVAVTL
jgi:antitoxin HicB